MTTRGIRNNNPGNIDRDGTAWEGMAPDQSADPRFVVFAAPEWGLRAIARILLTYEAKGLVTVRSIVNRWAPSVENDTAAYVTAVAGQVGVDPDRPIDLRAPADMVPMLRAIIVHENGCNPYPEATYLEACRLAGLTASGAAA